MQYRCGEEAVILSVTVNSSCSSGANPLALSCIFPWDVGPWHLAVTVSAMGRKVCLEVLQAGPAQWREERLSLKSAGWAFMAGKEEGFLEEAAPDPHPPQSGSPELGCSGRPSWGEVQCLPPPQS